MRLHFPEDKYRKVLSKSDADYAFQKDFLNFTFPSYDDRDEFHLASPLCLD